MNLDSLSLPVLEPLDFGRELLPLDEDGRNHDKGGADELLLRFFLMSLETCDDGESDFDTSMSSSSEWMRWGGGGSFTNSGRLRRARGSDLTISGGTASRINSGKVSRAFGSLVRGCGIAS